MRDFGKKYILIIVFTSILLSALFVLYYFHERSTIVAVESKDLKSVFEIKSGQIAKWINERIIDGQYIKSSPTVKKYLLNPFDDTLRKELKKRLAGFSLDDSYGNVRVFDKEMNHLFSSGIELEGVGKELKDYIEKAADEDSVILSDFFSCEFHNRVHLELIIPISDDGKNIGFVLIDVLPEAYLYQMMQSYPLSSKTSEILIVRREGDSVLYLNNLRHKPDAALKFAIPLSSQDVPAVKAVLGERGFITGIDYRGERVLAYIDSVPFMDWHMVAKIDLSEVYSSLSYKFLVGIIILLFSLSIVSSFMLFFWLSDRNKFLSKELEREKKLKILNSYLETIVETAPVAIYDIDVDGRVKSIWNREAEMMFGIAKADVIGKMLPIVSELKREEFDGLRSRVLDGNPFRGLEVERQRIDKSKICLSLSTAPTFDLNGKVDGVIAIALDITEKKMQETELKESISNLETLNEELQTSEEELISAEEELRTQVEELELSQKSLMESEEKFRIALKNANITVFTTNSMLEYTWVYNPPAGLISSNIIDKTDFQILEKEQAKRLMEIKERVLKTRVPEESQIEIELSGRKRYFSYNVEPINGKENKIIGLMCATMDITERRSLEEELFQAYKMEAVGQLAGGVAHDFNNMLAGIMGSAEMLQYKLAGDETLLVYVINILKASEHAARLTSQLLSFARKGQYQRIPVSVHRIIADVVSMLENTIDKKITIEQNLKANPSTVLGDPSQIQNAVLNLAINARDAFKENVGKIIISTENIHLTGDFTRRYIKNSMGGEYLLLKVEDNGAGMTDEVKKHLFEPFFTTKETGKGTGLGLASVYGIVKNHNGVIEAESTEGKGTVMKVYMPISSVEPVEVEEIYPLGSFNGLGKTVLVVDDEELIRMNTEEILLKYGYRVLNAKNGRDAVEIYKKKCNSIDMVMLDMIMPDMDGRETFVELKKIKYEVKVLLSTGYSADEEADKMRELRVNGFIQKPFKASELLKKMHNILK